MVVGFTEMKIKKKNRKKICLPGYENVPMLGETNNQFSMA
jgi:hypothetical protein